MLRRILHPLALRAIALVAVAVAMFTPAMPATPAWACDTSKTVSGTVGRTAVASTWTYCTDSSQLLVVSLQWSSGNRDLALRVTEPNGIVHLVDHPVGTSESYMQPAPLPEGPWTVEVINNGRTSVKYNLSIALTSQPGI